MCCANRERVSRTNVLKCLFVIKEKGWQPEYNPVLLSVSFRNCFENRWRMSNIFGILSTYFEHSLETYYGQQIYVFSLCWTQIFQHEFNSTEFPARNSTFTSLYKFYQISIRNTLKYKDINIKFKYSQNNSVFSFNYNILQNNKLSLQITI